MYLSDIHTHSIASGHGTTCTISDMAKAASQKGLKLLGITDHGPATLAAGTSSYFRSLIYSPRKRFDVELLYGIELNILDTDGKTDLPQELLDKLPQRTGLANPLTDQKQHGNRNHTLIAKSFQHFFRCQDSGTEKQYHNRKEHHPRTHFIQNQGYHHAQQR